MTKKSGTPSGNLRAYADKQTQRNMLFQRVLRLLTFSVLFLAGFIIYQTWLTQQNDVYADGQITGYLKTEVRDTRSGQQLVGWPVVKFVTADNKIVTFTSPDHLLCQTQCENGPIGVYYQKDNPGKAQIADFGARYGEIIVWSVIAFILLVTYILHSRRLRILARRRYGSPS
ncbi:hypothetical protein [Morganella morganii]|uniref:hypothetical protein n=1 Tax=Morganella morganii TaxID=582 RepID=UPI0024B90217|nr:hypothetical protein [Morganella morganii]ELB1546223.1 hypothetical protein [Morganella morganii]BEP22511.1 hypothetical protein SUGSMm_33080 [Morganella morganii subsp. sibonii]HDS6844433.1 hypothetical protein [Morganella morganii subsp. morganii]HDU8311053.1 hypothetical protein [Morganella morganii subsp. sibonii]